MRIIKSNTATFETFHNSLPYLTKSSNENSGAGFSRGEAKEFSLKYFNILQSMLVFEKQVKNSKNFQNVIGHFNNLLKTIITFKEANLFLFDENKSNLVPLSQTASEKSKIFVNRVYGEGILNKIFSEAKPKLLKDSLSYDFNEANSFYLIIPILEDGKSKGVFSLLTTASNLSEDSPDVNFVQMGLTVVLNKIDYILQQRELKNIYGELHVYQSKLANDYKLSAIGELTSGIVEDILSPLQVITSTTELLREEVTEESDELLDTINIQVKKVKNIINRLVNFAGVADGKLKVQPCGINQIINDFYQVVVTSLQNDNYECVLDLEDNLPSVLSHPNYINQLLSYLFSLLKNKKSTGGGIIIQTKYYNERINLKVLSTEFIPGLADETPETTNDVNLRIIKNIMKKHEGQLKFETDRNNGTVVHLIFPLKRNINQ